MANAPTHPPNRSNHGGSPPKGPRRMPRSRRLDPAVVRARLTVLSDRLHRNEADADLAETVDAILAPRGWELLKKPAKPTTAEPNVALWMNKSIKEYLEAKARQEAKDEAEETGQPAKDAATILAAVVNEGWEKFLSGEFKPQKPLRSARGSATPKMNLNVRPKESLGQQVQAVCPAKSKELGWEVTPGLVAMAWLYSEYGITDDDQLGVTSPEIPVLDD